MSPGEAGLTAAYRLQRIDLARARLDRAHVAYNYAALQIQMAEVELALAEWASETGNDVPGFNSRSFKQWLKEIPR